MRPLAARRRRAAALTAFAIMLVAAAPAPAAADCAPITGGPFGSAAAADVIVRGVALGDAGSRAGDLLYDRARFRVLAYEKGAGPRSVTVPTAIGREPNGMIWSVSEGIQPAVGETWRLYASRDERGRLSAGDRVVLDSGERFYALTLR